jgi:hypothetical protein
VRALFKSIDAARHAQRPPSPAEAWHPQG